MPDSEQVHGMAIVFAEVQQPGLLLWAFPSQKFRPLGGGGLTHLRPTLSTQETNRYPSRKTSNRTHQAHYGQQVAACLNRGKRRLPPYSRHQSAAKQLPAIGWDISVANDLRRQGQRQPHQTYSSHGTAQRQKQNGHLWWASFFPFLFCSHVFWAFIFPY